MGSGGEQGRLPLPQGSSLYNVMVKRVVLKPELRSQPNSALHKLYTFAEFTGTKPLFPHL